MKMQTVKTPMGRIVNHPGDPYAQHRITYCKEFQGPDHYAVVEGWAEALALWETIDKAASRGANTLVVEALVAGKWVVV